jgi:hypothetical protein
MPQLPFEALSPEERAAARNRQRRTLAPLPGTTVEAAFLATEARRLTDIMYSLEDALLAHTGIVGPPGEDDLHTVVIANLRAVIPEQAEAIGKLQLAAQFDISAVKEAQMAEEVPVGVSASQFKAVRASFRQREEAAKKALVDASRVCSSGRMFIVILDAQDYWFIIMEAWQHYLLFIISLIIFKFLEEGRMHLLINLFIYSFAYGWTEGWICKDGTYGDSICVSDIFFHCSQFWHYSFICFSMDVMHTGCWQTEENGRGEDSTPFGCLISLFSAAIHDFTLFIHFRF